MAIQSIETRWFFPVRSFPWTDFFEETNRQKKRTDWYAYPCDEGCGIKIREGRLQTKLRIRELSSDAFRQVPGKLEEWIKWDAQFESNQKPPEDKLRSTGWVPIVKDRYLRIFLVTDHKVQEERDLQNEWWKKDGCQFEWTALLVDEQPWWTLGFEAFGSPDQLVHNLIIVFEQIFLNKPPLLSLENNRSFGYAEFLNHRSGKKQE